MLLRTIRRKEDQKINKKIAEHEIKIAVSLEAISNLNLSVTVQLTCL